MIELHCRPRNLSSLAVTATIESGAGLLVAERVESADTNYLITIDSLVVLDFDAFRRLTTVEVIAPAHKWPVGRITLPPDAPNAYMALSEDVQEESISLQADVTLARSTDAALYHVRIGLPNAHAEYHRLGPNVYGSMSNGELGEFIFFACSRGS